MRYILGLPRAAESFGKRELRYASAKGRDARGLTRRRSEDCGLRRRRTGRENAAGAAASKVVFTHALQEAEVGLLDRGDQADNYVGNGLLRIVDRQRGVAVDLDRHLNRVQEE